MYKQHFGLQRSLFEGGIAREEDVFLGPRQQLVIANLKMALTTPDSIVTITGALGVGKTTLASTALRMTTTRLALAWVGGTPLNSDELLELLLAEFEFTPYGMGRVERLRTWRQFMTELSVTDTRLCILVENAQDMAPDILGALESFTTADPNGCPGANVVLMGNSDLHQILETPALAQLKQRIRSRQRLDPLSLEDVEAYLRRRVTAAGGDYEAIFAPGTAAVLHCYSAGIPRVIGNICETTLALAAARKAPQVTPPMMMQVASKVYGLAPSGPLPAPPVATSAPAPQTAATSPAPEPAAVSAIPAPAPVEPSRPVAVESPVEAAQAESVEPAGVETAQVESAQDEEIAEIAEEVEVDATADAEEAAPIDAVPEIPESEEIADVAPIDAVPEIPELDEIAEAVAEVVAEPPILTDAVDIPSGTGTPVAVGPSPDLQAPNRSVFASPTESAVPVEDTSADVAPAEITPEEPASPDSASATSLEKMSSSLAESLFGDAEMQMLHDSLEAAGPTFSDTTSSPGESENFELSADETAAVLQLEDDSLAVSEEEEQPEAAPSLSRFQAQS